MRELIERLEALTDPSQEMDALILCRCAAPPGSKVEKSRFSGNWCIYEPAQRGKEPFRLWEYREWFRPGKWPLTSSLDAAIAFTERMLPGWSWRVATCCVSDDAWVAPDFNCPKHGERLRRDFDEATDWVEITDVDIRPSGNPAIALLISTFDSHGISPRPPRQEPGQCVG